jgi:poly(A) polymerase
MEKIYDKILSVSKGSDVYIVGGWIRDMLLKRRTRDLDLAVRKDPKKLAGQTARALAGRLVVLDDANKIYRIMLKGHAELDYIDFSKMKGKNIKLDLLKRDFTIDSMALLLDSRKLSLAGIIDPYSGMKDIRGRIIRVTSPSAFKDDPLRLLRAYRLAAQLGFDIHGGTLKRISRNSALILKSAPERVRDELLKILAVPDSAQWIEKLEKTGLLNKIVPEIMPMKKSARKFYFHPKGLWQHSLETLEGLEEILSNLETLIPRESKRVGQPHLPGQ